MRIAGIDYGTVRIGIATADTDVCIASPYENYTRRTAALDAEYFAKLAKDERIGRFVVGLPVHLHGGESQKSAEARAFGVWLQQLTGVAVDYFDERFTTAEADAILNTVVGSIGSAERFGSVTRFSFRGLGTRTTASSRALRFRT